MSIKSKRFAAAAAALALVGGVGAAGALTAGSAAAATPTCGNSRIKSKLLTVPAAALTLVGGVGMAGMLTAAIVFQAPATDRRIGLVAASPGRRARFSSIRAATRRASMAPTGRARQLGWAE
jgi:hypothetical protein